MSNSVSELTTKYNQARIAHLDALERGANKTKIKDLWRVAHSLKCDLTLAIKKEQNK